MGEAARIILELLKLGRSPEALLGRAAMAEQRAALLEEKAKRFVLTKPKKADRIMRRAVHWQTRAVALEARAKKRGAIGC